MICSEQKFDYEKKRWGVSPITNIYTDFQGLELSYFLKDVLPLVKGIKRIVLLDSGCGGGNIPSFFKDRFPAWEIIGIDISGDALSIASKRFPQITFIKSPAHKVPKPDKSIDIVTSFDSLEHYENIDEVLSEINRVLKKGGIFYVSVPLEKQFPTLYWVMYKFGWRGKKHFAGHVNFFNHKDLIKKVESHGFQVKKKRFSYHLMFSIADVTYYLLQSYLGNQAYSFESSVAEMDSGIKKLLLSSIKKFISAISFFESRLMLYFPGGKGHFVFIKKDTSDFFSSHPPVTVLEEYQQKFGLKKYIRPKDLFVKKFLDAAGFKSSRQILDFGCANGIWLERILSSTNKKGVGVDIAEKLIDTANSRRGKKGTYICNKNKWPLKENEFDLCISLDTFEHIENKKEEIRKIFKSMKKNGKFLFYTLNPNNKFTFDWLFEKLGSNYLYDRADHNKELFISPKDFAKLLKKEGFSNVDYVLYDGPFNLFWEVFCYLYLLVLQKTLSAISFLWLMRYVLYVNDLFVRITAPINSFLDRLFFKKGYSNGYFIWGEK